MLLVASYASATDYYVRPASGEYSAEDGSDYENAYDGFTDIVWADVDSGNGKLFVCGTFYEELSIPSNTAGESGTPIHIISCTIANGASADDPGIINGGGTLPMAIYVGDTETSESYITIEGLEILNNSYSATYSAAVFSYKTSGGSVSNFTLKDTTIAAPYRGIYMRICNNCLFDNVEITAGTGDSATAESDAMQLGAGTNNIIDGCTFITDNTNESNTSHQDALQLVQETNPIVRNSYFETINAPNSNSQTWEIEDIKTSFTAYNNVLVHRDGNTNGAMQLYSESSGWTATTYLWNNVVYNAIGGALSFYENPANSSLTEDISEVKNNVLIAGNTNQIIFLSTQLTDKTGWDYNCLYSQGTNIQGGKTWAQWTAAGYDDDGGINTDPSLDANYAPDAADDPVVDVGADLSGSFTTDKNGVTRTVFDIGAYEWVGVEPTGAHITIHSSITVHDSLTISE